MARKKTYTYDEAYRILRESEGRNSPKSGEPGHTILQHVGGSDAQVSNRLTLSIGPMGTSTAPIIMGPSGTMASREESIEIYKEAGLYPSKNQATKAFDRVFTMPKMAAGTFLDQQQAAEALRHALNSTEGQTALGKLDGGSKREFFTVAMAGWSISGRTDAHKMYTAKRSTGGSDLSDLTHIADFTKVTVGIDALNPDAVHLQTCYPVE